MAIQKITSGIIQDGAVAAADIVSVSNTAISGLITASQIASVANTQLTGLIQAAQIGSANATLITAGTLPGARLPANSVLQIKTFTSDSNASGLNTTGVTYYASGFIVTITPSSANSKILLLCSSCIGNDTSASGMSVKFYRSIGGGGYSAIGSNALATQYTNNMAYISYQVNMFGLNYLDSPGTTSAVSYQLYFQGNNGPGSGTVYLNGRNNDGLQQPQLNLTAVELA